MQVTPNLNIEFFTPSRPGMRRYSAAAVCATDLQRTAAQVPGATNPNQASSLLQQIGTGVVSCNSVSKQMGKIKFKVLDSLTIFQIYYQHFV